MPAAARQHSTEVDRAHNDAAPEHEAVESQAAPAAIPGGAQAQRGANGGRNQQRTQHAANSQDAAGAEGRGAQNAQGAPEGEQQQEPLPAPPAYQPINPPVEEAPKPDPVVINQAEVEKQENAAVIEEQTNQEPEGLPETLPEAPAEEAVEAPPLDPAEAAVATTDPEAAQAEAARKESDEAAATIAATGPTNASAQATTAGPLSAGNTQEMFSAYVTAAPTQKAAAHGSFASGVGQSVKAEHDAFEGELPPFHATMNGEADVDAAKPEMNLGEGQLVNEPGTRAVVEVEETPAAKPYQDNDEIVNNIFGFIAKLFANLFGGDGGRNGIFSSLRNVRDKDKGANTNTGPAPAVPLEGDSDTKRVADQQKQAGEQTAQAHGKAREALDLSPGPETITPMTMDEAFVIPTLNAPTTAELPAEKDIEYFLGQDLTPELEAAFDTHYGPDMQTHLAEAQSQVDAATVERDSGRETAINDARAEHERLSGEAQQTQAQEVINNRTLVTDQRKETHRLQDEAAQGVKTQLETERRSTMGVINKKVAEEQKKIDDRFNQAEADAQVEVDKGDQKAKAERDAAEKEAEDKSWWDKASDFVSACFDALKTVINGIFDAVRAAVNVLIDAAKSFAKTIIDKACEAICGLIDTFAELAKGLVRGLLSEAFPEFTENFCQFVDEKKEQAKQAVQVVAENLKAGVEALCDALKEGLNAVLNTFQAAVNAAIDVVKAVATGDWAELARKLITAGALAFGLNPTEVLALLDKAGESISLIVDDPMGFVTNVLGAMNKGFGQFGDHFLDHLKVGFVQWLTGPMPGLKIPEDVFSLEGAFDLAMQVLGVTPEHLKQKAAKHIGEDNVELLEQVWGYVESLLQGGWAGLWEHVQGQLADMQTAVVGSIMDYVKDKVVKEAVLFIAGLFSPLPGIPKVIKVVWETYCWLKDNIQRIYAVVETVVNTMHDLATGNIQPAADGIERALANMVPVAIDLLAGILGLGDLPAKLQGIIQALQDRIDLAIDTAIDKFKGMFKGKSDEKTRDNAAPEGSEGQKAQGLAASAWKVVDAEASQAVASEQSVQAILNQIANKEATGESQAKLDIEVRDKLWNIKVTLQGKSGASVASHGQGSVLKTRAGNTFFTTTDIQPAEDKVHNLVRDTLTARKSAEGAKDQNLDVQLRKLEVEGKTILDSVVKGLEFSLESAPSQGADGDLSIHALIEPNYYEWTVHIMDGAGLPAIEAALKARSPGRYNQQLAFLQELADTNSVTVCFKAENRIPAPLGAITVNDEKLPEYIEVIFTDSTGQTLTVWCWREQAPINQCALTDRALNSGSGICLPHDVIPAADWRNAFQNTWNITSLKGLSPTGKIMKTLMNRCAKTDGLAVADGPSVQPFDGTVHADHNVVNRYDLDVGGSRPTSHPDPTIGAISRQEFLGQDVHSMNRAQLLGLMKARAQIALKDTATYTTEKEASDKGFKKELNVDFTMLSNALSFLDEVYQYLLTHIIV